MFGMYNITVSGRFGYEAFFMQNTVIQKEKYFATLSCMQSFLIGLRVEEKQI